MKFTAKFDEIVENKIKVFKDGEMFCHLSIEDFFILRSHFKVSIEMIPCGLGFTDEQMNLLYANMDLSGASLTMANLKGNNI